MDYYVYLHRKKTNGEVFYVGKGKEDRAWDYYRSDYWKRITEKHGRVVEILEHGLQEWYAFELEKYMIAYYGRKDLGYGKLINFTDGGEGSSGVVCSKETREKMSLASLGKPKSEEMRKKLSETNTGHSVSSETREKIRVANTGKVMSEEFRKSVSIRLIGNTHLLGHRHSEETKVKISEAGTGRVLSNEAKANIAKAKKGELNPMYGVTSPRKGVKLSEETKQKLREAQLRRYHGNRNAER